MVKNLWGGCFTQGSLLFWHKASFPFVQLNALTAQIRENKIDFFFMVESFMVCYFNYFHFYTMLWNICGPVSIKKVYILEQDVISDVLYCLKPSFLPPRTPKSLTNSILLVCYWQSKMFVMVLKKLGDHFKCFKFIFKKGKKYMCK